MYRQSESRFVIQGFEYPSRESLMQAPPIVFQASSDVNLAVRPSEPATRTSLEGALLTAKVVSDEDPSFQPPHLLSLIDLALGHPVEQNDSHWQLLRVILSAHELELGFYDQSHNLSPEVGYVRLVLQRINSARLFCSLTKSDNGARQTTAETYRLVMTSASSTFQLEANCTTEVRSTADRTLKQFDVRNFSLPHSVSRRVARR